MGELAIVELIRSLLDFNIHYEMMISRIGVGGFQSEKLVRENFRLKSKSFVLND